VFRGEMSLFKALKIIGIIAVSVVLFVVLVGITLFVFFSYHIEWTHFSDRETPIFKSDGIELSASFWPIGYSRRLASSYPYSTMVIRNPYRYEIGVRVSDQEIKSVSFGKIVGILPNNEQIDFWPENIDGKEGRRWSFNPVLHHNGVLTGDEIKQFRNDREIIIDKSQFNVNPPFDYDSFYITFTPVKIDIKTVDYIMVKIKIIIEYDTGEKKEKEVEYRYNKEIIFEDFNDRID